MPESVASARRLEARDRALKALELKRQGASFPEIGRALGYKDHTGAVRAVHRLLERFAVEHDAPAVRRYRQLAHMRCEAYRLRLNAQLRPQPLLDPAGRAVLDPDTGRPMMREPEEAAVNRTIRTLLRVDQREAALLGYDKGAAGDVPTPPGQEPGGPAIHPTILANRVYVRIGGGRR